MATKVVSKNHINQIASTQRFIFLDYLRIYAFLSVLLFHRLVPYIESLSTDKSIHATIQLTAKLLLLVIQDGMAGVVVFFLVSGYIITHVIQSESPAQFAIKRLFRIYPIYIFAVLLRNLLYSRFGQADSPGIILNQLTLLGDFSGTPYALGGIEWTLRIELIFYIMMFALCCFNRLFGRRAILTYLVPFALVLVVLPYAPPFINASFGWGGDTTARGSLTLYFPFLIIGSLIYLLERKGLPKPVFWLALIYVFFQFFRLTCEYQPFRQNSHHALVGVIVFLAFWRIRDRCIGNQLILYLSGMTYSVYLFHNWIIPYVRETLLGRGVSEPWSTIAGFLAMSVLCILGFYCIEKPFNSLGRSIAKRSAVTINSSDT
jgi:peptidoglycan/LPS O-acetylase OafA/YrhL